MRGDRGFFDIDVRPGELSAKGDDLERLQGIVDCEIFRTDLERAVARADRAKGGRPPYDHVPLLKILMLQSSHSLSDQRTEYLIKERLSFMRLVGLSLAQSAPDANSIWNFREADAGVDRGRAGDRRSVQTLRGRADQDGLPRHGRTDHRRHDCRRAQTAQPRG